MPESGINLSPDYIRWVFGGLVFVIGVLISLVYGHLLSRLTKAEHQILERQKLQHKDRAVLAETVDRVKLLEIQMKDQFAELRLLTKMLSELIGWDNKKMTLAKFDARSEVTAEMASESMEKK